MSAGDPCFSNRSSLTPEPTRSRLTWVSNLGSKTDYFTVQKQDNTTGEFVKLETINNKFLDNKGHPALSPPWGTLNAIDLNTGEYLWKMPYGEYDDLTDKTTGSESYGGPVVTASGLLFIAGTKDGKFRVFNKKTGQLLWETRLPAAAFATPATYQVGGKQYVVLACGGTKLGAKKGNQYVAFALP